MPKHPWIACNHTDKLFPLKHIKAERFMFISWNEPPIDAKYIIIPFKYIFYVVLKSIQKTI
jgi:hypothetical protein